MSLTSDLIRVADAYCAETGMSRSRLSTIIMGNGVRLDAIASGGDGRSKRLEQAMAELSALWPSGVAWPSDIDRPCTGDALEPRAGRLDGRPAAADRREGAANSVLSRPFPTVRSREPQAVTE